MGKTIKLNTNVLAYVGDGVYEVIVRKHIVSKGSSNLNKIHKCVVTYVKGESQAYVIKTLFDKLPIEEQDLVKRARNRKITSKPRNVDPMTYKWATAFEAFVGYLFLTDQEERLAKLVEEAIVIIDQKEQDQAEGL